MVCVASAAECPLSCNDGETLCAETGQCGFNCTSAISVAMQNEASLDCACPSRPVACPRVIDDYAVCQSRFAFHYHAQRQCQMDQEEQTPKVSFASFWFVLCYGYYGGLAMAVMAWCWYNQVLAPVATSTVPLLASTSKKDGSEGAAWTQTGYQSNAIGAVLDFLVELSFVGVQFLLLVTTLLFYTQQGAITAWQPVFESEVQALQAFILVWMGGFVWCFGFRYPSTGVQSLFLRRCELQNSAYVAVVAPIKTIAVGGSSRMAKSTLLGQVATMVWTPVKCVLRTIFSHPYDQPGLETVFCPVATDPHTQTRSILHRMRRYVYDDETSCFIPCAMNVGITFGELSQQVGGLTNDEAHRRLGRQGPNVIPLSKPSILRSLYKEFRKSFYLYQNFCIWAFANFWFFFMSFVYTFYRFVGALVVVYFQHRSDSLLYNLSHVEGTVEYVMACTRVSHQRPRF
jgi:Cation transporter/ATPase, N-terminus